MNGELIQSINLMAEKMGVAADKLYPALRYQATLDGSMAIVWLLACVMTITLSLLQVGKLRRRREKADSIDKCDYDISIVLLICLVLTCAGITLVSIQNIFTAFCNPDWYIIKMILNQIGSN
jgi:hypothetical protein